jgi:uncharacterized sodium:solute symporter family permease YidK
MLRIKQFIIAAVVTLIFGMVVAPTALVHADASTEAACNAVSDNNGCNTTGPNITSIVKTVINILSVLVGVVAVIMIIIGGLKYVTSNGDSNAISSAKNTILYAIVGLVIVAMSQFIVQFVLNKSVGASCSKGQVLNSKNVCVVK